MFKIFTNLNLNVVSSKRIDSKMEKCICCAFNLR